MSARARPSRTLGRLELLGRKLLEVIELVNCPSVCLTVCLCVCLFVYLSICLSDCRSVCLFICLSVCLPMCLPPADHYSVCPFVWWRTSVFLLITFDVSSLRQTVNDRILAELPSDGCLADASRIVLSAEHVQAVVSIATPRRGNLVLTLISPQNTTSILLPRRSLDDSPSGFTNWAFTSVHFWGENPTGIWRLLVEYRDPLRLVRSSGKYTVLKSWSLILYGTDGVGSTRLPSWREKGVNTFSSENPAVVTFVTKNGGASCVSGWNVRFFLKTVIVELFMVFCLL